MGDMASARIEFGIPDVQAVLFESSFVRLLQWKCTRADSTTTGERHLTFPTMSFPDRRPFFFHGARSPVLAGRNEIMLLNAFSPFRTSHPFGRGDTGRILTLRADVLADIAARYDPAAADRPDAPFRTEIVSRSPRAQLLEQLLFRQAGVCDALEFEETAIEVGDAVLSAAAAKPVAVSRPGSRCSEAVETAKGLLSTRLGEPMGLEKLMPRIRCSPYSLMRSFRSSTGLSLRQYRTRARLHAAVERLLGGESDLGQIGVDLGFTSHSHFTSVFRRVLGLTPSELRQRAFAASTLETLDRIKRGA